jgi:hypothetical protein
MVLIDLQAHPLSVSGGACVGPTETREGEIGSAGEVALDERAVLRGVADPERDRLVHGRSLAIVPAMGGNGLGRREVQPPVTEAEGTLWVGTCKQHDRLLAMPFERERRRVIDEASIEQARAAEASLFGEGGRRGRREDEVDDLLDVVAAACG